MTVVVLTEKAERQLERLGRVDRTARRLLSRDLEALEDEPPPRNLDLRPRKGAHPWIRLRQGDWRAALFPVTRAELEKAGIDDDRGYVVYLVVNKKDFEKAARRLPRRVSVPRR
jgi:mRNA-degrading endonuclease RelE of RelBE toxin-antitoxin system